MTKLVFKINVAARQISRVKQGDMPDDMVDFCSDAGPRTVVTGRGLSLNTGDTVKLELCPNKGAAIAVLDQLRDIQVSPDGTELSFLNYVNSSSHPDGDWWGQDVLLTITIGGIPTTRWLTFKNWY